MNLVQEIDAIAQQNAARIVYDNLGTTNTYRDLKQRSDALAAQIDRLALADHAPIIVYGDQTFNTIVAMLACAKSGHAYIPVDQHSPAERLTMIEEISHAPLVIAINALPIALPGVQVIAPAALNLICQQVVPYSLTHPVNGDQIFYIIFTSGTTGKPKGVQISHDNLRSFVDWMVQDFGLPQHVVGLSQTAYSFDLSVMDLYPTLLLGGELQALDRETTGDFKRLFSALGNLKINFWVSTPSFADICLLAKTFDQAHYPQLTHFCFCGEELTASTARRLKQRFPQARIFNTYGPTETTVAVTAIEITDDILNRYDRLPIGYAKADTRVWVASTGADQSGEIMISGPTVSQGYLNAPDKTAQAFDPGDQYPAYHTGDVGVQTADGLLFFGGRMDFQIKMHGYRIELEEINHYLNKQPQVHQGVIVPKYNHEHKVAALIAYVVTKTKQDLAQTNAALTETIKRALQTELMPYMMPQQFVYRDQLPLNMNGKVDIKALIKEVNPNG